MQRVCVSSILHRRADSSARLFQKHPAVLPPSIENIEVDSNAPCFAQIKAQIKQWKDSGLTPREYNHDPKLIQHWSRTTLEMPVVFHVYCPLSGIAAGNRVAFLQHLHKMLDQTNRDFNARCAEFDNADFSKDPLFSTVSNPFHARDNRKTYLNMLTRARASNIRFVLLEDQCVYHPTWNGIKSRATPEEYRCASDPNSVRFRQVLDKYVKFDTANKPTAYKPESVCNIWVIDFPSPTLAGFSTFPTDAEAGTPKDGLILAGSVCQPNPALMDPTLNRYKTLAHEIGHFCNACHPFEPTGDGCDDIPLQTVDFGNLYDQTKWPLAVDSTPEDINNIMGYQSDAITFIMTQDQVVRIRTAMLEHRAAWTREIPCNDVCIFPSSFRNSHRIDEKSDIFPSIRGRFAAAAASCCC